MRPWPMAQETVGFMVGASEWRTIFNRPDFAIRNTRTHANQSSKRGGRMRQAVVCSFALVLMTIATARAGAPCGHCHSGHRCACESCESYECVKQPDHKTIKKVVYDVKCVPVCEHRPSKFLHCDCCPVCQLKFKKVLVKREVVVCEICTTK